MQFYFGQIFPVLCKDEQGILLDGIYYLPECGIGKLNSQLLESIFFIIGKGKMANPFYSGGDNNISKRGFCKAVINIQQLAAIFILTRCHSFNADKQIV